MNGMVMLLVGITINIALWRIRVEIRREKIEKMNILVQMIIIFLGLSYFYLIIQNFWTGAIYDKRFSKRIWRRI